jgi:hypothetical protein
MAARSGGDVDEKAVGPDPEIAAISEVHAALKDLDPDAQSRVLKYVADKLGLSQQTHSPARSRHTDEADENLNTRASAESGENRLAEDGELEGISPAGKKWMARSGLQPSQLSSIFSLGGDEIDLIAKSVPGNSKAKRMRSVILLKGLAAYLGTGAARLTDQEVRETCLHYDALDAKNFATTLKGLASEVSGSKETGYTLSARGQASATEMVRGMVSPGRAE